MDADSPVYGVKIARRNTARNAKRLELPVRYRLRHLLSLSFGPSVTRLLISIES